METNELTDLEAAEKDLRFYTAIIGHRPTVDADAPVSEEIPLAEPILLHPTLEPEPIPPRPHKPHVLRLWIRQVSSSARKRIDEAYHRLAS